MAFSEQVGGERYNLRTGNAVPKRMSTALIAVPPTKFMLVKLNTSNNDQIDQCASGDVPYGFIFSLTGGIDMATVLEWRDNHLGAISIGDKVVADGSAGTVLIGGFLRDRVKRDNTNGLATVVNKDEYVTGVVLLKTS